MLLHVVLYEYHSGLGHADWFPSFLHVIWFTILWSLIYKILHLHVWAADWDINICFISLNFVLDLELAWYRIDAQAIGWNTIRADDCLFV